MDIARNKAIAADLGVTTVAAVRHRLTFSPLVLDDDLRGRRAALGGVYIERKKELTWPLGYGDSVTATALGTLGAIYSR